MNGSWKLWGAVLSLALMGCGNRLHSTASYAISYRQAFARQVANPDAASKPKPLKGLDAPEAAAVVSAYRNQLAGKTGRPDDGSVLLVAPAATGSSLAPYMPLPSVPAQQPR